MRQSPLLKPYLSRVSGIARSQISKIYYYVYLAVFINTKIVPV